MSLSTTLHPPKTTIIGTYSPWPRKPKARRTLTVAATSAVSLGVFLHCIAPMLINF